MIDHRFYLHIRLRPSATPRRVDFLNLHLTLAEYYSRFVIGNFQSKVYYEQYYKHCDYHNYRGEYEAALSKVYFVC